MLNLFLLIFYSTLSLSESFNQEPDIFFLKGKDFLNERQLDSAVFYLTKAIEIKKDYDEAYFWRGIAKEELEDLEGAIEDYSVAIIINQVPKYYNNRGMIFLILDRHNEAIENFKTAIEINPKYSSSWYNLGMAYSYRGEQEKACENIKRAFELGLKGAKHYLDTNCS